MLIAEQMTPAAIELARLLSYFADIDGSEDMKRRDRNVHYDAYCCLVKAILMV